MSKPPAQNRKPRPQPPSLFDRLLDFEPDKSEEYAETLRQQLRGHKDSIRRDLEALLNTQQPPTRLAKDLPELPSSLMQYGSPGFHGLMLATKDQHLALARSLQELIATFEPRLQNVRVSLGEDKTKSMRALTLKIRAETRFDDSSESVIFDTQLDPSTRQFRIVGGDSRG